MVKDRLAELREKCLLTDEEFELDQIYEQTTLLKQKQMISDLNYFGEIFSLINDLRRNIREIESHINGQESSKDVTEMAENANFCFRIFSAVKRLQAEMDKQQGSPEVDEIVREVRRVQFEGGQSVYIEAYWEYDAFVRRYEEVVKVNAASKSIVLEIINEHSTETQQHDDTHLDDQPDETTTLCADPIKHAEDVLHRLVERRQSLAALEGSLLAMRNHFVLFSTLVMEHGSILNVAQGNVQVASEAGTAVAKDLKEASECYSTQ